MCVTICENKYICVSQHTFLHTSEIAEVREKDGAGWQGELWEKGKKKEADGVKREGWEEHAHTAPTYSHACTQEDQ